MGPGRLVAGTHSRAHAGKCTHAPTRTHISTGHATGVGKGRRGTSRLPHFRLRAHSTNSSYSRGPADDCRRKTRTTERAMTAEGSAREGVGAAHRRGCRRTGAPLRMGEEGGGGGGVTYTPRCRHNSTYPRSQTRKRTGTGTTVHAQVGRASEWVRGREAGGEGRAWRSEVQLTDPEPPPATVPRRHGATICPSTLLPLCPSTLLPLCPFATLPPRLDRRRHRGGDFKTQNHPMRQHATGGQEAQRPAQHAPRRR